MSPQASSACIPSTWVLCWPSCKAWPAFIPKLFGEPYDCHAITGGPIGEKQSSELDHAVWDLLESVTDPKIPVVSLR